VRIIAATNRDLEAAVQAGTFREDLYYRLNVILIKTPPLRIRTGDIPILANAFLKRLSEKCGKKITDFEADAMAVLENFSWPGNIRELENVVERAVTLESGSKVQMGSLPIHVLDFKSVGQLPAVSGDRATLLPIPDFTQSSVNLDSVIANVEKYYLIKALEHSNGVKKVAAELLGITFRSIRYRLKKLGLEGGSAEDDEG
jgi:two-component system response regulator PilR (NtrC family)